MVQRSKDYRCQSIKDLMKHLLRFLILIVFIPACRKDNRNGTKNLSVNCLQTTFIATNISEGLQSTFFINGKDGFVAGANGGIYKTSDSAKSWIALNSTVSVPIRALFFLDALKGFAVGGENSCGGTGCIPYGGFILETLNGGQTWRKVFTPSDKIEISSIYFFDNSIGFCAGDNVIFKTVDGGQTWSEYKINDLGGKMMQILFVDALHGYITCLFDKILRTENGGVTWEITSPHKNFGYYSLSASNGSIYVSGQGKIIKSVDTGNSWSVLLNSPLDIFAIHFLDRNIGFAFGRGNYSGGDFGHSYGSIYCTNNGGLSWNGSADIEDIGPIQSVSFPTDKIGYAISVNKIIRLTIN